MRRAVAAMVMLVSPLATAEGWGEPPARSSTARGPEPKLSQRKEALDLMQAALGQWERERRDFHRDLERKERALAQRAEPTPPEEPPVGKVIEAGGRAGKSRYGKIIEVAPAEEERPKSALEKEIDQAEERAESVQRRKREDPATFAREKEKREQIREGNRAWDEAVQRRFEQRQAAIEEQGRRMQAELDAARRREALIQAKKLGGTIDAEGNFVDPEVREDER